MVPYVDDAAYTTKSRVKGTIIGIILFAILFIAAPFLHVPARTFVMGVIMIGLFGLIINIENKFVQTIFSTLLSIIVSLMYISPSMAISLKLLWLVIGIIVVTIINFRFLPYSIEKETKNNLNISCKLNNRSIELVKSKCMGDDASQKTTLLVISNIVRGNIAVNEENKDLFYTQIKITDWCNFILTYMGFNCVSDDLKLNLIDIIEKNGKADENLTLKERVIAYSMEYVMKLFNREKEFIEVMR